MKQYDLLRWKEFGQNDAPSIAILFSDMPYPNQEKVARYLENGTITVVRASCEKDAITGELIKPAHSGCLMTDGDLVWNGSLSYYVRKYNLRLPTVIEERILSRGHHTDKELWI